MIKVLIVDDYEENLYLLDSLLGADKFQTVSAKNGKEALNIARTETPDLIISDILMPVMDGYTFIQECKKDDVLKKVPFVFYTATYTDSKDEEFAMKLGAARFIIKPQEPDDFLVIIDSVLSEIEESSVNSKEAPKLPEKAVLKEYNEVLVRKIEHKMLQAEKAEKELRIYTARLENEIEERKKAEEALVLAKEKAEELNKLKTVLLANLSHELRTPLVSILGYSELIGEVSLDNPVREMATTIYEGGKRLLTTFNNLLQFSSIESKKIIAKPEKVNLLQSIADAKDTYQKDAEDKGLKLISEFSCDNLVAFLDKSFIKEILENIIHNAVKFTHHGHVKISAAKQGDFAIIEISDTGIGISEEYQKIIYEEFRQASEGLGRFFEGIGLGLTLTNKFVKLLNGEMSLKSKKDEGSVFTIKLPLNITEDANTMQQPTVNVKGKLKRPQLLCIEDDPINVRIINDYLKDVCVFDSAENADAAIEKIETHKYDIFLMDINLKGNKNGIHVTKHIREMEQYKSTPIIALTAYAMYGDKEKFLEAGCSDYLSKPFKKQDLIEKVLLSLK